MCTLATAEVTYYRALAGGIQVRRQPNLGESSQGKLPSTTYLPMYLHSISN